jgi:catechol 2,3-dioxygenase-like lactoylglutathione lyase family enzyme
VKRIILILSLAMLWPSASLFAQLEAPNEMGVAMGQVSLLVRADRMDAEKKFWTLLGGTAMKIDGVDVYKFPGVFVFLVPGTPVPIGQRVTKVFCGCPDDGIEMSTINHIGFNVQNYDDYYAKFTAAGGHIENFHDTKGRSFFFTPDGVMLEIAEGRGLTAPAGQMHVHTFVNDVPPPTREHQVVPFEMYLWYHKMFGAELNGGGPGSGLGDHIPGGNLRISQSRATVLPTKGRPVDHIGFEIKNLEAFCKQLEANGVKLDAPYSTTRHKSFASAELTDPWGTSIELTEGLNKF